MPIRKGKQKPGSKTKADPVNLERIQVKSGDPGTLPPDLPMRLSIDRVMGVYEDSEMPHIDIIGLLGHIVGLDFYTKGYGGGTFVEINLYRDPNGIKIQVNGEEIWRWVENSDELPLRSGDLIGEQRRVDGEWVEQVSLKPGDEVGEGNVITRADPAEEDLSMYDDDDDEIIEDEEDDDGIIWD